MLNLITAKIVLCLLSLFTTLHYSPPRTIHHPALFTTPRYSPPRAMHHPALCTTPRYAPPRTIHHPDARSFVCYLCLFDESCPTLWDPMDCSPPGSSVHGDSTGKNTGVGCHALLQEIFPIQGSTPCLFTSPATALDQLCLAKYHYAWFSYASVHLGHDYPRYGKLFLCIASRILSGALTWKPEFGDQHLN